jgi:hypothetical protein
MAKSNDKNTSEHTIWNVAGSDRARSTPTPNADAQMTSAGSRNGDDDESKPMPLPFVFAWPTFVSAVSLDLFFLPFSFFF